MPDSSPIEDNLAGLVAESGDKKAAAALLRSAILKRPEDARLRHSLSKVLEASDPRQAIASAKAAAELEPDNPSFQDHLVGLLFAAERIDDAALALAKALPLSRQHGSLCFSLSRLLQRRERPDEALGAARRGRPGRKGPGGATIWRRCWWRWAGRGRPRRSCVRRSIRTSRAGGCTGA